MSDENTMTTFNLKLPKDTRRKFKGITHDRGTTMQAVLSAFTESFVEDPSKFKIKMEIVENGIR